MLEKINDNAYKIELPGEYGVSATFNAADLSPFFGSIESRTTPFQEGEDDEDITTAMATTPQSTPLVDGQDQGPITRSRAKQIQNQVNANLSLLSHYINTVVFPICSTLIVLRCIGSEDIIQDLEKEDDSKRGAFEESNLWKENEIKEDNKKKENQIKISPVTKKGNIARLRDYDLK